MNKDGAITVFSKASPKKSTSETSGLVGKWKEVDVDNTYTFNADGTGREYYDGESWDMKWTLNGTTLTVDFGSEGIEEYKITLNGEKLTVVDTSDNTKYEYTRE